MSDDKTDEPEGTEDAQEAAAEQPEPAAGGPSGNVKDGIEALKSSVRQRLEEVGIAVGEDGQVDAKRLTGDDLKKGAQMLMSMIGQVARETTQAARDAGAKQRAEAGEGDKAGETGDKVIDLDQARQAREGGRQPGPFEQRLTKNLRTTFNRFLAENAKVTGETEDHRKRVSLDNDFVKHHGGKLVGELFGAFASSIFPPGVKLGETPEEPAEPVEDSAETSEPDAPDVSVEMNLDFLGLIRSFMPQPPEPSAGRAPSEAKKADEPEGDAPEA